MKWKALFAGDITMVSDPDEGWISQELKNFISSHEIASCNFEGPIMSGGKSARKAGPHVNQSPEAPRRVMESGFKVISLANNHIMDYGSVGLQATLNAFQGKSICIGAGLGAKGAYAPGFLDAGGIRVGILSFCESEFGAVRKADEDGFAWVNHAQVDELVSQTRSQCEVLIIQVHAGVEEEDLPLPEWRDRYRQLLDLGADVVIGHHPHQPQGWEWISGKLIAYSLGNFYFQPKYPSPWSQKGAVASLEFDGSRLVKADILPITWERSALALSSSQEDLSELSHLCRVLEEPEFSDLIASMADRLWESRYSSYYLNALNGIDHRSSIGRAARLLFKSILAPNKLVLDEPLLLHNIVIESHRWVVERALRGRLQI